MDLIYKLLNNHRFVNKKAVSHFCSGDKLGISDRLFVYSALMLALIVVVIPNSFRALSLPLIFVSASLALKSTKCTALNFRIFIIWLSSALVTFFFTMFGYIKGYPDAVSQTIFVYVISPALWLFICSKILGLYSPIHVIRVILLFGVLGGLSVFLYYYMFFNFGPESLTWLIAEPAIQYGEGVARANMHVFGALMFVSGGFIAAPQIIEKGLDRFIATLVFLSAAFLSGRSALMLSIVFGLCVFFIGNISISNKFNVRKIIIGSFFILFLVNVLVFMRADFSIDVIKMLVDLIKKISEGGGDDRVAQAGALIEGIQDSWLLGAGHGVNVSVIRNDEYPWRYELLWLATIFRVGVFGAIIYLIPIWIIIYRYVRQLFFRKNTYASNFMFGGFLASFIGSATNPYYESFEFQWMLTLPFIYFMIYGKTQKS